MIFSYNLLYWLTIICFVQWSNPALPTLVCSYNTVARPGPALVAQRGYATAHMYDMEKCSLHA